MKSITVSYELKITTSEPLTSAEMEIVRGVIEERIEVEHKDKDTFKLEIEEDEQ